MFDSVTTGADNPRVSTEINQNLHGCRSGSRPCGTGGTHGGCHCRRCVGHQSNVPRRSIHFAVRFISQPTLYKVICAQWRSPLVGLLHRRLANIFMRVMTRHLLGEWSYSSMFNNWITPFLSWVDTIHSLSEITMISQLKACARTESTIWTDHLSSISECNQ
jgi:hypothetical protein